MHKCSCRRLDSMVVPCLPAATVVATLDMQSTRTKALQPNYAIPAVTHIQQMQRVAALAIFQAQ